MPYRVFWGESPGVWAFSAKKVRRREIAQNTQYKIMLVVNGIYPNNENYRTFNNFRKLLEVFRHPINMSVVFFAQVHIRIW